MAVDTPKCPHCAEGGQLTVPVQGYMKWTIRGAFIQDALPELSDAEREQLLTGTHPACRDEMMGPEDEDDDESATSFNVRTPAALRKKYADEHNKRESQ